MRLKPNLFENISINYFFKILSVGNTVMIGIPDIPIPETSECQTFTCPVLRWYLLSAWSLTIIPLLDRYSNGHLKFGLFESNIQNPIKLDHLLLNSFGPF